MVAFERQLMLHRCSNCTLDDAQWLQCFRMHSNAFKSVRMASMVFASSLHQFRASTLHWFYISFGSLDPHGCQWIMCESDCCPTDCIGLLWNPIINKSIRGDRLNLSHSKPFSGELSCSLGGEQFTVNHPKWIIWTRQWNELWSELKSHWLPCARSIH